jgi:hypothetical protein
MPPGSDFLPSTKQSFSFLHAFQQKPRVAKSEELHPSKLPSQIQSCFRAGFLSILNFRRFFNEDKWQQPAQHHFLGKGHVQQSQCRSRSE